MGTLSHLDELEAEAIYIMREVAADVKSQLCFTQSERTVP